LSNNNLDTSSSNLIPSFATTSITDPTLHYISNFIDPYAAAGRTSKFYNNNKNSTIASKPPPSIINNNSSLHTTNSPKLLNNNNNNLPSNNKDKHLLCKLCNNLHSSPWHTTDMCPLKDPTFIVSKKIRENVLQHNNLYGKVNKKYHKDIDFPTTDLQPTKATIPVIANSAHSSNDTPSHTMIEHFDTYAPSMPP
jgi:hypothetical protein